MYCDTPSRYLQCSSAESDVQAKLALCVITNVRLWYRGRSDDHTFPAPTRVRKSAAPQFPLCRHQRISTAQHGPACRCAYARANTKRASQDPSAPAHSLELIRWSNSGTSAMSFSQLVEVPLLLASWPPVILTLQLSGQEGETGEMTRRQTGIFINCGFRSPDFCRKRRKTLLRELSAGLVRVLACAAICELQCGAATLCRVRHQRMSVE